jgi:hypothetical protein
VWVLDVEALNTHRGNTINVYSSSSYELSKFFSNAGSARGRGEGLTPGSSLGASMCDDLPEVIATARELKNKGCVDTGDRGGKEALLSYCPTNKKKG